MLSTRPALRRSAMICSRKPSGMSARSAMTRTCTGWSAAPLMLRSSIALMPYSHLAEKIMCSSYPRSATQKVCWNDATRMASSSCAGGRTSTPPPGPAPSSTSTGMWASRSAARQAPASVSAAASRPPPPAPTRNTRARRSPRERLRAARSPCSCSSGSWLRTTTAPSSKRQHLVGVLGEPGPVVEAAEKNTALTRLVNPPQGGVGLAQGHLNPSGGQLHPEVHPAHPVTDQEQPHAVAALDGSPTDRRHDFAIARVAVRGEHHSEVHVGLGVGRGLGESRIGGGSSLLGLGDGAWVGTALGIDVGGGAGGVQLGLEPWMM